MNVQQGQLNPALFAMAFQNAMSQGGGTQNQQLPSIQQGLTQLQSMFGQGANTFAGGQSLSPVFMRPGGLGSVPGVLAPPMASPMGFPQAVQSGGPLGLQNCFYPNFQPQPQQQSFMQKIGQMLQNMMQLLVKTMQSRMELGSNIRFPQRPDPSIMYGQQAGAQGMPGGEMGQAKAGAMGGFVMGGFIAGGVKQAVATPKPKAQEIEVDKPKPKPRPRPNIGRDDGVGVGIGVGGRDSVGVGLGVTGRGFEGGDGGGDGGDGGDGGGDGDPLAFDLNGDGRIGVTGASTAQVRNGNYERGRTVEFDLDGDGKMDTTEWMKGGGDGLLIDNRDGKAAEDMSGKRLFGDEGGTFKDGIAKLKRHDLNNDGKISGEELKGLDMWVDDGDAKVQEGEIKSLHELGIKEVSVERNVVENESGEKLMRSTATREDGSQIMTEDVWFAGDFSKKIDAKKG